MLFSLAVFALFMPACSSDNDPTDPGGDGTPTDTTAPQLVSANPPDGEIGLTEFFPIDFTFNEIMDQTSLDGQVTLSQGTFVVTWTSDRVLSVVPSGFAPATELTITIGTGLTDLAGNHLAASVTRSYWTHSDVPLLMDHTPAQDAVNVNRAVTIHLMFSEAMNPGSFPAGITVSDGAKALYPYTVQTVNSHSYALVLDNTLAETTLITVNLGTEVQSEAAQPLGAAASFTFTTGAAADVTPPSILSVDPPSGSVMPVNQDVLTIVFNEPMDPQFSPAGMNGQFAWLMSQVTEQPTWNFDFTELTVQLPASLPAGLPLEVTLANYADANGQVQTAETNWNATIAGTADPAPVADGQRFRMEGPWSDGPLDITEPTSSGDEVIYIQFTARSTAGQWNKEEYLDANYQNKDYYDILSVGPAGVELVGFAESNGGPFVEFFASSPLTWLDLPFAQGNTWQDTATVTDPNGTFNVVLAGEVIGQTDLAIADGGGTTLTWTDVWRVELSLAVSIGGEAISSEQSVIWYAPGVGIVREQYREERLNLEDDPGWHEFDHWLVFD